MFLEIVSKKDGFRRAGQAWTVEPITIDTNEKIWTDQRIKMLKNESTLTVTEVEETDELKQRREAKEAAKKAADDKKAAAKKADADKKALAKKADADANKNGNGGK